MEATNEASFSWGRSVGFRHACRCLLRACLYSESFMRPQPVFSVRGHDVYRLIYFNSVSGLPLTVRCAFLVRAALSRTVSVCA